MAFTTTPPPSFHILYERFQRRRLVGLMLLALPQLAVLTFLLYNQGDPYTLESLTTLLFGVLSMLFSLSALYYVLGRPFQPISAKQRWRLVGWARHSATISAYLEHVTKEARTVTRGEYYALMAAREK